MKGISCFDLLFCRVTHLRWFEGFGIKWITNRIIKTSVSTNMTDDGALYLKQNRDFLDNQFAGNIVVLKPRFHDLLKCYASIHSFLFCFRSRPRTDCSWWRLTLRCWWLTTSGSSSTPSPTRSPYQCPTRTSSTSGSTPSSMTRYWVHFHNTVKPCVYIIINQLSQPWQSYIHDLHALQDFTETNLAHKVTISDSTSTGRKTSVLVTRNPHPTEAADSSLVSSSCRPVVSCELSDVSCQRGAESEPESCGVTTTNANNNSSSSSSSDTSTTSSSSSVMAAVS